ncbi:MAG TPA: hypothetical protein PKV98_19140 [Burkholderiaceae bacterium]|nr:hypothetical protein [Burkholderiaceae bacterium]
MMNNTRKALAATLFGAAAFVAGCGGDSSTPAPTPTPPPPSGMASPTCTTAGQTYSVVADATVAVGRTAGAVVAGCSGALRDVTWQQTGGPSVTLQSATTQAISFDPPSVGLYTFRVSFTEASGTQRIDVATINAVAPTATVAVVARSDQAVRAGGKVSVRAWPAASGTETLTWRQTAGPTVTLDTSDQNRILFTAPNVTQDTALVFRVTRTSGTTTDFDDVMVLVEAYTQAPPDPSNTGPYIFSDSHVSRVYPYKPAPANAFAGVLVNCVFNAQLQYFGAGKNLCSLSTLPFINQSTPSVVPTVAQIMDRVLVSHDWMGRNFESFLQANAANTDLLRLFNGVTAIVIGAHVRPSYYYSVTGAIYLDADNFWLTADERDVIDEAPDYRSDFDRDLQYSGVWRYVDISTNTNIFLPFKATERVSRDVAYLLQESNWLLYHELGHASDFVPVAVRGTLNSSLSPWDNIAPRYSAGLLSSDRLSSTFPLQSAEMKALAQIKFVTGPVSDATLVNGIPYSTLKTYTPAQVGGFFATDRATDEYNYSTSREDLTMTFEEVMMSRNHNWRRDVAFTDKATATSTSETLIVRWGQRGRVGDPAVRPRAQFIVSEIAPWLDSAAVVSALPAPIAMRPGESWKANLVVPAPPGGMASPMALRGVTLTTEQDQLLLRRALSRQLIGVSGPSMAHWAPNERVLKHLRER